MRTKETSGGVDGLPHVAGMVDRVSPSTRPENSRKLSAFTSPMSSIVDYNQCGRTGTRQLPPTPPWRLRIRTPRELELAICDHFRPYGPRILQRHQGSGSARNVIKGCPWPGAQQPPSFRLTLQAILPSECTAAPGSGSARNGYRDCP